MLRFSQLALAVALATSSIVVAAGTPDSVEELVKAGDIFDRKMQAAEALKCYLPAETKDPQSVPILTRIARQYRHLMADAPGKAEKLRLGQIGLGYAKRAAALGPADSEAQASVAISYGKLMPILSVKEQVDAAPRVKSAADKALALDPRNDNAWHVLGRWNRILAEIGPAKRAVVAAIYGPLPPGSYEEAIRCFQKAIAIDPNRLIDYVELGRVYAQMGRKEEARRYLNKGLAMPNTEKDDPEAKEHAREALAKLR